MAKIVIASDSFKGCLSSREVADAVAAGITYVMPGADIVKVAIADGGEGSYQALATALKTRQVTCEACDPLMRPRMVAYGITPDGTTAVMDMAAASGLTLLSQGERNPIETTTYGFGQMIADALRRGCRRFILGLGGSATNDAGTGALAALGFRFLDRRGHSLGHGGKILGDIASVDSRKADTRLRLSKFHIACDVSATFCGPHGATNVFAHQKGADSQMVRRLENGMLSFADVIKRTCGIDIADTPGAGAAGGLGGALAAFVHAEIKNGAALILDTIAFDDIIADADLIITGEGCLDRQTVMGKAPAGVLAYGLRHNIPVAALGGRVCDRNRLLNAGFASITAISPLTMPLEIAMQPDTARQNLTAATARLMRSLCLPS